MVNIVDGRVDAASSPSEGVVPPIAIIEMWLDDGASHEAAAGLWLSVGNVGGYVVEEVVQRPIPRSGRPGQTGGVTNIFLVSRRLGISMEEFAQHWKQIHGPLALRVHYGMTGYVQNIAPARFLAADEAVDGFSNLQFPSVDDSINKLYLNEERAAEVGS